LAVFLGSVAALLDVAQRPAEDSKKAIINSFFAGAEPGDAGLSARRNARLLLGNDRQAIGNLLNDTIGRIICRQLFQALQLSACEAPWKRFEYAQMALFIFAQGLRSWTVESLYGL